MNDSSELQSAKTGRRFFLVLCAAAVAGFAACLYFSRGDSPVAPTPKTNAKAAVPAQVKIVPAQTPPAPSPHKALAGMPWYDGIVYLRNQHLPVEAYLPVVRTGLRNTEHWPLRLREAFFLSKQEPWGEMAGVLIEAVMAEVTKQPKGIAQARKGAELFGAIFIGQPEALIAQKLLWEQNQQEGLRLSLAQQVIDSIRNSPTSPETDWLLSQAKTVFAGEGEYLNSAVQSARLAALPAGHKDKRPDTPLIVWASMKDDLVFEQEISRLPLPDQYGDLAGGEWDPAWKKLRALEFQMRRFYLTASGFVSDTERISALSTDDADTLRGIAARLRTKLQTARGPATKTP